MFSQEIRNLLVQVITSWQVLAVTVVLVLYVFMVNYAARMYHRRPRQDFIPGPAADEESSGAVEISDSVLDEEDR